MSIKEKIKRARSGLHSIREKYKKSSRGGSIKEMCDLLHEGRGLVNDIPITIRPPSGDFNIGFNMGTSKKRKRRKSSEMNLMDIAEQGW